MPGSGVKAESARALLARWTVSEAHGSCSVEVAESDAKVVEFGFSARQSAPDLWREVAALRRRWIRDIPVTEERAARCSARIWRSRPEQDKHGSGSRISPAATVSASPPIGSQHRSNEYLPIAMVPACAAGELSGRDGKPRPVPGKSRLAAPATSSRRAERVAGSRGRQPKQGAASARRILLYELLKLRHPFADGADRSRNALPVISCQ